MSYVAFRLKLVLQLLLVLLFIPLPSTSISVTNADINETMRDDFDSTTLDPSWFWIREDPTHWSLMSAPGYLRIITQPKDIWRTNNNAPILLHPSTATNFFIETKITTTPMADHHQGGLVAYASDDNYIRLTYVYLSNKGGRSFEFAKEVNGTFQPIQIKAPQGDAFYLRLLKLDNNYLGYYSSDGTNWEFIGQQINVPFTISAVGLSAFNAVGVTRTEIPADFDFFQIVPVGVTRMYLPRSDGQTLEGILSGTKNQSVGTRFTAKKQ